MGSGKAIHCMKVTPYHMKHKRPFSYEDQVASLYVMDTTAGFKIGISSNVDYRLKVIQSMCPLPITVVYEEWYSSKSDARQAEIEMHKVLAHRRIHGEWFKHRVRHHN